ncbi:hypothetical protein Dimus_037157 [Dionaea muscipula]
MGAADPRTMVSEYEGGERVAPVVAVMSPVGDAVMSPVSGDGEGADDGDAVVSAVTSTETSDVQPQPDVFGASLCLCMSDTVILPPFPSVLAFVGDCVDHVGVGMVSEEGRVSPGAREALRPQPADGLRQSLSPPVEPVMAAAGGVELSRSYAHVVQSQFLSDCLCFFLSLFFAAFFTVSSGPLLGLGPDRLSSSKLGSAIRVTKMRRLSRRLGGLAPSVHGSV